MRHNVPLLHLLVLIGCFFCYNGENIYAQMRLPMQVLDNNETPINGPICEGDTIHLVPDFSNIGATGSTTGFNWTNRTAPGASLSAEWDTLTIAGVRAGNALKYTAYMWYPFDPNSTSPHNYIAEYQVSLQPNPNVAITIVQDLCTDGATDPSVQLSATPCIGCSYDWRIYHKDDPSEDFEENNLTTPNLSFAFSDLKGDISAIDVSPSVYDSLFVELEMEDHSGCIWEASEDTIYVIPNPIESFSVPATVPESAIPIDLSDSVEHINNYVSAELEESLVSINSSNALLLGMNFYPFSAGSYDIRHVADYYGCTFHTDETIDVVNSNIEFKNITKNITGDWEACAEDRIRLKIYDLNFRPTELRYTKTDFTQAVLELIPSDVTQPNAGEYRVKFAIPDDAITGNWLLAEDQTSNSPTYTISEEIIVHNIEVGLSLEKDPICFHDTIDLVGFPSGGVFSIQQEDINNPGQFSLNSDMLQNDWLIAEEADVDAIVNEGAINIMVIYEYTYEPRNGFGCVYEDTIETQIYDNRLASATLPNIEISQGPTVDLNALVSNISPELGPSSGDASITFGGTYVQNGNEFLVDAAQEGTHNVVMTLENKGCSNSIDLDCTVYSLSSILPSPICFGTDTVWFYRDAGTAFAHSIEQINPTTILYKNNISRIDVLDALGNPIPNAITPNAINQNGEYFILNVNLLRNHFITANAPNPLVDETATLEIVYRNYESINGSLIELDSTTTSYNFGLDVLDPVEIVNLPASFCPRSGNYSIETNRNITSNAGYFILEGGTQTYSNGENLAGNLLNIQAIVSGETSLQNYELIHVYEELYGCEDRDTATFVIPTVPQAAFSIPAANLARPDSVCLGTPEFFLDHVPNTQNQGFSITFNGRGTSGNASALFSPEQAGTGTHQLIFSVVDNYNCEYNEDLVITILDRPSIDLSVVDLDRNYCITEDSVKIDVQVAPSGGTGQFSSVWSNGNLIVGNDSLFHPNEIPSLINSAVVSIQYDYQDGFGCAGTGLIDLTVRDNPDAQIGGLGNRYCANDNRITLTGEDLQNTGTGSGVFLGDGIQNGTSFYLPSLAGVGEDTVTYIHTDVYGCKDTVLGITTIDTIPVTGFLNVEETYCKNDAQLALKAYPEPSSSSERGVFSGPGLVNGNNIWLPEDAGIGTKTLSYTFENSFGCIGHVEKQVEIRNLPSASFFVDAQYCINADMDTLIGNVGVPGTGIFSGTAITSYDSITLEGILDPGSISGAGIQQIDFTFTDTFGCVAVVSEAFYLNDLPIVSFSGLEPAYCSFEETQPLTGFPLNGIFNLESPATPPSSLNSIVGGTGTFSPEEAGDGTHIISYTYTDGRGCTNTYITTTSVFSTQQLSVTNAQGNMLDSIFCESDLEVLLNGIPTGGAFSGNGVSNNGGTYSFNPFNAGNGPHDIVYTYGEQFTYGNGNTLVCESKEIHTVSVKALPSAGFTPTTNTAYCDTTTRVRLYVTPGSQGEYFVFTGDGIFSEVVSVADTTWDSNGNITNIAFDNVTNYYFDPSDVNATTAFIQLEAQDSFGCVDSFQQTYLLDQMVGTQLGILDPVYCESSEPIALPSGGTFYVNGVPLNVASYTPNMAYNASNPLPQSKFDTLVHQVVNGSCIATDTTIIEVLPVPAVSFEIKDAMGIPIEHICMGADTVWLDASLAGGIYSGGGVAPNTSYFIPEITRVGTHEIQYTYTDPSTTCEATAKDTFYIYSQPDVEFAALSGCKDSLIEFVVNNSLLGLDGYFDGALYDSVTAVTWELGENNAPENGVADDLNNIASFTHEYVLPGDYQVSLIVENRGHCVDTHSIRTVVMHNVSPSAAMPYIEDFETGSGNWLSESEDSSSAGNLWEWGIATGERLNTMDSTDYNQVWATRLTGPYSANESGWVYSPCIDLTALNRPMLKFDYFLDTKDQQDGAVVEYFDKELLKWVPLGELEHGINWYNSNLIFGQPGEQTVGPIGWSGENLMWKNARYKLDPFMNQSDFRLRIAFGAASTATADQEMEGFAFDNFWVGNRTRNVLLEHFSCEAMPNMGEVNEHVYRLALTPSIAKDVNLIQYPTDKGGNDQFFEDSRDDLSSRAQYYSIEIGGRSFVDGYSSTGVGDLSRNLVADDFEYNMLEDPAFNLQIVETTSTPDYVEVELEIEAMRYMPRGNYEVIIALVEDHLEYDSNGEKVHAILRKFIPDHAGISGYEDYEWLEGDRYSHTERWNIDLNSLNRSNLRVIAFIQQDEYVFQSTSNSDLILYPDGFNNADVLEQAEQLFDLKLYPNPATHYFNVEFDAPLKETLDWQLVDLLGRTLKTGTALNGTNQISVDIPEHISTGSYFFVIGNNQFKVRKGLIVID